jgi:serine/threonine protein kinase
MDFKEVALEDVRLKPHCDSCSKQLAECTCSIFENNCAGENTASVGENTASAGENTASASESDASSAPARPPCSSTHGPYRLGEMIGEGGSGRVFKSKHQLLGKTFAVKVLRKEVLSNNRILKRFHQEVNASSQLTHHGLCQIFDHGLTNDGAPYLVMEHLEGEDLRHTIGREGPLDPRRVVDLFVEVCDAVAHAHYKGVIHRDLKPSNIIVQEKNGLETVKIVDFGVAKLLSEPSNEGVTQTGEVLGSPLYMSPEQCIGKSIDARSDIYSLGCCMYECLTGKPPHQGDNPVQTILKQINDPPEPFGSALGVPSSLQKIIMTALQKNPDKRYQSAQEMYSDLLRVRENKPPRGPRGALRANCVDTLKKCRKPAMVAIVALACLSIPVSLLLNNSSFKERLDDSWRHANSTWTREPWAASLQQAKMEASYGNDDLADPLFQKALQQAKSARRPLLARDNVLNSYGDFLIGAAEKGKGTWAQARKAFAETVVLAGSDNPASCGNSFERIGFIDSHMKDYAKAEQDYDLALENYDKEWKGWDLRTSDPSIQVWVGTALVEQGNNFINERKIKQARAAFVRASEIMTAPQDQVYVAAALKGIAQTYEMVGNYDESDRAYNRAQQLLVKLPHSFARADLISILNERILVLQKLGDNVRAAELEKQLDAAKIANNSI